MKTKERNQRVRVLLAGAGHAHLHVVRQARRLRAEGVDLTLVSPATFEYSGAASGILSGALDPGAGIIDVAALASTYGVCHRSGRLALVDTRAREVSLTDGSVLAYDALSLNVGSVAGPEGWIQRSDVWAVKPLTRLGDLRGRLLDAITLTGRCPTIVVAGGGVTGFEIAAALAGLCERQGIVPVISLIAPDAGPRSIPRGARIRLGAALEARGVRLVTDRVSARNPGVCRLESGCVIACDFLVQATGLMASDVMRQLKLPTDPLGRLLTHSTFQSVADPRVFAAGDCAVIESHPRPCVGVFGVRAGPILVCNLLAWSRGSALKTYRPQRVWLSILDLGNGKGLAVFGSWWWLGHLALRLKRRLDLGFVTRMSR